MLRKYIYMNFEPAPEAIYRERPIHFLSMEEPRQLSDVTYTCTDEGASSGW